MSNDYEYLADSQMPPMAPRPPTNAPPDLITGLPNTPALKANDDVDLESNRPLHGNKNNLSFSDGGINPKRSEPSVATTKTSRSTESDEETQKENKKEKKEEKTSHKWGTCWCIFAAITIFLAVIILLGLGAFLLMNNDVTENKPQSAALNGTNGTSTTVRAEMTTTSSLSSGKTGIVVPELIALNHTTEATTLGSSKISNSTTPMVSNETSTISAMESSTVESSTQQSISMIETSEPTLNSTDTTSDIPSIPIFPTDEPQSNSTDLIVDDENVSLIVDTTTAPIDENSVDDPTTSEEPDDSSALEYVSTTNEQDVMPTTNVSTSTQTITNGRNTTETDDIAVEN